MQWKFEFLREEERIFGPEMMALWGAVRGEHVFNSPEVIRAWMRSFGAAHHITPLWVVGTAADGNRSLWPLVIWRRNWKNAFVRVVMPADGGVAPW